jgi:hypothetical protein
MGIFLVAEGTWALGMMTVVLIIGLVGVGALGWYVVRCDAQNRHAERDLLVAEGHGIVSGPVEAHAVVDHSAAPVEAIAVEPAPAGDASPAVPRRRRKGH